MFKAVTNLREQKGFTLIELLIVIAIIGILAAIAIPAFLGQREKAKIRSVVASSKGAVSEVQGVLDSYVAGEPFIALDSAGVETCWDATGAYGSKTCPSMYSDVTATGDYTGIDSVKQIIVDHHAGKSEYSPYESAELLFVSLPAGGTPDWSGAVGIVNSGARGFQIIGWAESTAAADFVFNTIVTAR